MQAVSIIGFKKSGKTSLVFELCQHFKQKGISTAVAKFSHHPFDASQTDTAKLSQCAATVFGLSEEQTQVIWNSKKYLPDLIGLSPAQVLLVEGGKNLGYLPKVIVSENEEDIRQLDKGMTLAVWSKLALPDMRVCTSIGQLADLVLRKGFFLPGLDCQACGRESCSDLAREICSDQATTTECQALHSTIQIKINNQVLPLNPFVNAILANGISGLLSPLKGFQPGSIEIKLEV